ncbi:MAG: hypothetical protein ACR2IE_13855 [Candidatus Sumerlaeaceae bacterium]
MENLKKILIVVVVTLAIAVGLLSLSGRSGKKADAEAASAVVDADSRLKQLSTNRKPRAAPPKMPKIIVSSPLTPMDERRRAIVLKFLAETDPAKRRYIVPELVDLKDPQSVFQILELLKTETDPQVRDNLIVFLGYMPYSTNYAEEIIVAAREIHAHPVDKMDRLAVQRMAIELQHPASEEFLRDVLKAADTLPEERINAGEGLVRLSHEVGLGRAEERQQIIAQMQLDAQALSDPVERAQAYRALNVTRNDNREFYRQQLAIETDPDCRNVLNAYVQADVRPTPTRGPMKTPWPSPTPFTAETPFPTAAPTGTVAPYVGPTPQIVDEPLGPPAP